MQRLITLSLSLLMTLGSVSSHGITIYPNETDKTNYMKFAVRTNPDTSRSIDLLDVKNGVETLKTTLSFEKFQRYCDDNGSINFVAFFTIGMFNIATAGLGGLAFMGVLVSLDDDDEKAFSEFAFGQTEVRRVLRYVDYSEREWKSDSKFDPVILKPYKDWDDTIVDPYKNLRMSLYLTIANYKKSDFYRDFKVHVEKCDNIADYDFEARFSCQPGVSIVPK